MLYNNILNLLLLAFRVIDWKRCRNIFILYYLTFNISYVDLRTVSKKKLIK